MDIQKTDRETNYKGPSNCDRDGTSAEQVNFGRYNQESAHFQFFKYNYRVFIVFILALKNTNLCHL